MLSLRASELTRVMMSEADAIEGLRALFEEGRRAVLFRSCSGMQPGESDDETDAKAESSRRGPC